MLGKITFRHSVNGRDVVTSHGFKCKDEVRLRVELLEAMKELSREMDILTCRVTLLIKEEGGHPLEVTEGFINNGHVTLLKPVNLFKER